MCVGCLTELLVLQSLVLSVAAGLLEEEAKQLVVDRANFMAEAVPPLAITSGQARIMVETS